MLMAVGLLVILVMLGTMFLMITRLDAKQAKALAEKAPADPLAQGIVDQVRALLQRDLHIGTGSANMPYADTQAGTVGWAEFIDYPSGTTDNPWLASNDASPTSGSLWAHLSDLGNTGGISVDDVANNASSPPYVDTDGDTLVDAVLYATGVTNVMGDEYYAAVRVIDLGGMLNVNTASQNSGSMIPTNPVNISIPQTAVPPSQMYVPPSDYADLNARRWNGANPPDLLSFYNNCASKVLAPVSPYLPFAIGDELFLRWSAPLADQPSTAVGRLYEALKTSTPDAARTMLTTFNCSRNLVRHPGASWTQRQMVNTLTAMDNALVRQRVYEILVSAMVAGADANQRRTAAHFVANLWARLSADDSRLNAFKFNPIVPESSPATPETFTVYGVVEQPVIAEAFAYSKPDNPATNAEDSEYVYAIEVFNPTDASIDLRVADDTRYALRLRPGSTTDFPFPAGSVLGPGERVVVFSGQILDGAGGKRSVTSSDLGIPAVTVLSWPDLDFSGGHWVELVRLLPGEEIPTDRVLGSDFGYSVDHKESDAGQLSNGQRDDDTARDRVAVAGSEAMFRRTPANLTDHKLGAPNSVAAGDLSNVWEGFPIERHFPQPTPRDIGDLAKVYAVGPEKGGESLPEQLEFYKDKVSRGKPDVRGTVPAVPDKYPDIPWASALAEVFELLQADNTRPDPDDPTKYYRYYGKLNINTANAATLEALPWPTGTGANVGLVVQYVLAYRDKTAGPRDYSAGRAVASSIPGLRAGSDFGGFLTPGEIAIPLVDYLNDGNPPGPLAQTSAGYLDARDSLYRAVSNLITVNSDVFAVSILVRLQASTGIPQDWHYVAVIDRSNCRQSGQMPAVLLFSQVN